MHIAGISQRFIPRIATIGMAGRPSARRIWFDLLAFALVIAFLVFISWGMRAMSAPVTRLEQIPISLDVHNLPSYAMRTTMLACCWLWWRRCSLPLLMRRLLPKADGPGKY